MECKQPYGGKAQFEIIRNFHRAGFGAGAAAIAAIRTDILGFFSKSDYEIADVSFNFFNFGKVFTSIRGCTRRVNHFWCKNSYTAVHRWKGLVKLRHDPSNRGSFSTNVTGKFVQPGRGRR